MQYWLLDTGIKENIVLLLLHEGLDLQRKNYKYLKIESFIS